MTRPTLRCQPDTSHFEMSSLTDFASEDMRSMVLVCDTSHLELLVLTDSAPENMRSMLMFRDVDAVVAMPIAVAVVIHLTGAVAMCSTGAVTMYFTRLCTPHFEISLLKAFADYA